MSYTHLKPHESYRIKSLLDNAVSIAKIALDLKRSESAIRREIARNSGKRGYRPQQAQRLYEQRALNSRNAESMRPPGWPWSA